MKEFESSADAIQELETCIASFSTETHNPTNLNAPWHSIFLAANAVSKTFFTESMLDEKFVPSTRNAVISLLQQAHDTIPNDVNLIVPKGMSDFHALLQTWLQEAITMPTILLTLEDE